jgi:hypothetical protein
MMESIEYLSKLAKRHSARFDLWYDLRTRRYLAEFDIQKYELRSSKMQPYDAAEDIIEQLRTVKGLTIRYKEKGQEPITGEQGSLF